MKPLKGKTAFITGSTRGIGLGVAQELAKSGAHIIMNGFGDASVIEQERAKIEALGVTCAYSNTDMTQPSAIAALFQSLEVEHGGVDILVNNAGIQHVAPIEDFPPEKWDAIIAINLSSAFHTIQHGIRAMKKKGWGRIVNIASAHALVASPYKSAYVAAKHGLLGLTKAVALETAEHNITVNAICPGYVRTALVEGQIADTAKARNMSEDQVIQDVLLTAQHTKKFVTIEEVAALTLFLCSDTAQNITGSAQSIDGGWVAA